MPSNNESILSPNHPANNVRHNASRNTYTYEPPVPKFKFSLGWELEANRSAACVPAGVNTISDGSVNGDGTEYVVLPAVTRSPKFVLGLLKDLVHAPSLNTDKSCGYHVHMGIQGASMARLRQWAIATESLAKDVEDLAFQAVPDARKYNSYCRKIEETKAGTRFESTKYNNSRRYHWLNTVEIFRPSGIRTVEVRLLGNTHRWKYVLAWSTFCMLLGREGWKLAHRPFESRKASIDMLSDVLKAIIEDVKPLEKRHEPIPAWVYSHLKSLGIEWSAFDRPLIALHNAECELKGRLKKFYSDNQATEPNRSDDENDNDDSCPCGCGEEGRCSQQYHDDGDCDANECSMCHDDGNCGDSPDCYTCRDNRHDEGEYCGGRVCRDCERNHRGPWAIEEEEPTEAVTVAPLTITAVQTAVNELRNQTIDSVNFSINQVGIDSGPYYSRSIMESLSVHEAGNGTAAQRAESNAQRRIEELPMTESEQILSLDREAFYNPNGGDR